VSPLGRSRWRPFRKANAPEFVLEVVGQIRLWHVPPEPPACRPRGVVQPQELLPVGMAVARVGVAEAQADQLAVEQAAVGQEHVGQEAAVPVSRAAGGQFQAHRLAFAGTAGEGGRLGAEMLYALLGMPGLGRVDAQEADPGVPAAPVGRVDVQRVAVDHADDAERLAVIAPVVVARRRRAKAEEA
jgi:hypothetical protein